MEGEACALLRLPQEIRDEIYKYIILEQDEPRLRGPGKPIHSIWSAVRRYQTRLLASYGRDDGAVGWSTPAPLGQVNKRIRREMSDLLEAASRHLPIIARVENFDFGHVINYLASPAGDGPRLSRHLCHEDGTTDQRLVLELTGPYTASWHENLICFLRSIDDMAPDTGAELGLLHKTVACEVIEKHRLYLRAPIPIVKACYEMYLGSWPQGAGKSELEKVFLAMFLGGRPERFLERMSEGDWQWFTREGRRRGHYWVM